MAVDKMVDSGVLNGALEEIADAIRAKTGISGTLAFPDPNDFADAIDEYLIRPTGTKSITENGTNIDVANYAAVDVNVSGGGGYSIDDIALRNISGDIRVTANKIGNYAFANCTGLTSIYVDGATGELGAGAFADCTGLTRLFLASTTGMPSSSVRVFANVTATIVWLTIEGVGSRRFEGWKGTKLDMPICRELGGTSFYGVPNMDTLILRYSGVALLRDVNAFNGSRFASNGAGGTLYVPQSQISSYQSASNWSTILGYANNNIAAIEGSQYENYYADGTPIPTT